MRLADLNPEWFSSGGAGITETATGRPVPLRERVGVELDCPCGCAHRLYVPFANPPDGLGPTSPGHGWQRTGETFGDLTLTPSIQRERPNRCWHGFITNGEIITV
jgi:hypothetical protein